MFSQLVCQLFPEIVPVVSICTVECASESQGIIRAITPDFAFYFLYPLVQKLFG